MHREAMQRVDASMSSDDESINTHNMIRRLSVSTEIENQVLNDVAIIDAEDLYLRMDTLRETWIAGNPQQV